MVNRHVCCHGKGDDLCIVMVNRTCVLSREKGLVYCHGKCDVYAIW